MKIQEDKGLTMENIFSQEKVIVIDFGGQYNQLVARRVRECNVYCEIYSYRTDIEQIKAMNPKGIILTGGPNSCYEPDSAVPEAFYDNTLGKRLGGGLLAVGIQGGEGLSA